MKGSKSTFLALTILLAAMLTFLAGFNTHAATLTVKDFASYNAKEDESPVTILNAKTTVFAFTEGASLSIKGCYAKKINTHEPGPYKYKYIAKEKSLAVATVITTTSSLNLENALGAFSEVEKALKNDLPFFCQTGTAMSVEMEVEIETTKRIVRVVVVITKNKNDLVVSTPMGEVSLKKAITVFETK